MVRHRLDEQDFLHTVTPEEYDEFAESSRAAFDPEFDEPRERPSGIVVALVCLAAGALLCAVWYGVAGLVQMFGVAK